MKKLLLVTVTTLTVLVALTATAERKIWMYSNQGNHISMDVTELDSISFEEPGYLTLTPTSKSLDYEGGRFTVSIETNKEWTASVNDKTALILSKESGSGDDEISVLVQPNTETESYSAILTITLSNGQYGQVIATVDGKPLIDICGNIYSVVTIGTQTWMAENLKCDKYDTESEAYNASWLTNNTISTTSESFTYTPYYADASDKTKWSSTEYAGNLTSEQIEKLGYLYNWAAAVGIKNGKNQTSPFPCIRQGICPNGWHIPSFDEWNTLASNLGGSSVAGRQMKTTSGWYQDGNGTDDYGFAGLPSGSTSGISVRIGNHANFWTTTPSEYWGGDNAYTKHLEYGHDSLPKYYTDDKYFGLSVRCVKSAETLSVSPLSKNIESAGGTFDISVTSNTSWKVSSDQTWATISDSIGSGDGTIIVTVAENTSIPWDIATIELSSPTGIKNLVTINRDGTIPEKCKASDYPQVTIGTQTWMAENYRCSKYDTESEAYDAFWLTNNTIPASPLDDDTPYYTDAADKTKWNTEYGDYSGNLSNEQITKLGYLYNWAAAVGVENGDEYGTTPFSGNCQGICPNGWHVPTKAEWQTLANYIDGNNGYTDAGKKMKTTSGWYSGDGYMPGTDSYGFAALPSGYGFNKSVEGVGSSADFWSVTSECEFCPYPNTWGDAYVRTLSSGREELEYDEREKRLGKSVRCVKN